MAAWPCHLSGSGTWVDDLIASTRPAFVSPTSEAAVAVLLSTTRPYQTSHWQPGRRSHPFGDRSPVTLRTRLSPGVPFSAGELIVLRYLVLRSLNRKFRATRHPGNRFSEMTDLHPA